MMMLLLQHYTVNVFNLKKKQTQEKTSFYIQQSVTNPMYFFILDIFTNIYLKN